MRKLKNININIIILVIINCLIFQSVVQTMFPPFKYFDEIVTLLSFLYYLKVTFKRGIKNIPKVELAIWSLSLIMIVLGLMGNYLFQYQKNLLVIGGDLFLFFKYILVFFGMKTVLSNVKNIDINYITKHQVNIIGKLTIVTLIFMVINLLFGIDFMTYDVRFGIRSYQFLYMHAGRLNTICTMFSIFLLIAKYNKNIEYDKKMNNIMLMNLIVQISTLRSRGIVIALMTFIMCSLDQIKVNKEKAKKFVVIGIIIGVIVSAVQIKTYFFPEKRTPRSDLLNGSLVLMTEHFPIGTGFATYGTDAARKNYSILYYKLGFNKNYGMKPTDYQFLTDCFWPVIIGQFGILGLAVYIILLYIIITSIMEMCNLKYKKYASILIIINFLINSVASSSFLNYSAIAYMTILALILSTKSKKRKEIKNYEIKN